MMSADPDKATYVITVNDVIIENGMRCTTVGTSKRYPHGLAVKVVGESAIAR